MTFFYAGSTICKKHLPPTLSLDKMIEKGVISMGKRLGYSLLATLLYLFISNMGNLIFGISRNFSWLTTLWESLFFFIFIFLFQQFRKK